MTGRSFALSVLVLVAACGDPRATDPGKDETQVLLAQGPALVSVKEGDSVSFTLESSEPANDNLRVVVVESPANGKLDSDEGASPLKVTYTPKSEFSGEDQLSFTVSDGTRTSAPFTVTILVKRVNAPPVAVDDAVTVSEDGSATWDVLGNDADSDDALLLLTSVSQPAHGSAFSTGSLVVYTPEPDYTGADSFTYTVSDPMGETATGTITVTVTPVNDPPVAAADVTAVVEDGAAYVAVLTNDSDVDSTLALESVNPPAHGTATIVGGEILYVPTANFSGQDTFTYRITDGQESADAVVTVTVSPVNDAPVANDDAVSTPEDTPISINVAANDSDADDAFLVIESASSAAHGSVTLAGLAQVTYAPDANYSGVEQFTYVLRDASGAVTQATVTVTVNPVYDAPTANDDTIVLDSGSVDVADVLANDTAVEGALTITSVGMPAHGAAAIVANKISYSPTAYYYGTDSFTYEASDGVTTVQATVWVTVDFVNHPPYAAADANVQTDSLTPVTLDVLANDGDPDGQALRVVAVTQPAAGSAVIDPADTITFTPAYGVTGPQTFSYTVHDPFGTAATASVTVDVYAVGTPVTVATFTAAPSVVTEGAPVVLTWQAPAAASCAIDQGALAGGAYAGSVTVTPPFNLIYTLTCAGPGGPVSRSVAVTVRGDADHDGLSDLTELKNGTYPLDADMDDDGLLDGIEDANHNGQVDAYETDPRDPDSDGDGNCDGVRADNDGDGLDPADACTGKEVIYVNASATGLQDGSSWANAFVTIQGATAVAVAGQEIWVAQGGYPGQIIDAGGKSVIGGFVGAEMSAAARPRPLAPTVINSASGGFQGNGSRIDLEGLTFYNTPGAVDEQFHAGPSRLADITVQNGSASEDIHFSGGYVEISNLKLDTAGSLLLAGATADVRGLQAVNCRQKPFFVVATTLYATGVSTSGCPTIARFDGANISMSNVAFNGLSTLLVLDTAFAFQNLTVQLNAGADFVLHGRGNLEGATFVGPASGALSRITMEHKNGAPNFWARGNRFTNVELLVRANTYGDNFYSQDNTYVASTLSIGGARSVSFNGGMLPLDIYSERDHFQDGRELPAIQLFEPDFNGVDDPYMIVSVKDAVFERYPAGAIRLAHPRVFTIERSSFSHNGAPGLNGGAIWVQPWDAATYLPTSLGQVTLRNCIFEDNHADWGGALYLSAAGQFWGGDPEAFVDYGSVFTGNTAAVSGGAMYVENDENGTFNPRFEGSRFFANVATAGTGGAVSVFNLSSPYFADVTAVGNTAVWGGAIDLAFAHNAGVVRGVFVDNAASFGGAIRSHEGINSTFDNVVFARNRATGDGGALRLTGPWSATVNGSSWVGNVAQHGGAIASSELVTIRGNVFYANAATLEGGAVWGVGMVAANNAYAENAAPNGSAIFAAPAAAVTVVNNTFSANAGSGPVVTGADWDASSVVVNNVWWGNTGSAGLTMGTATYGVDNNCTDEDWSGLGTGNIQLAASPFGVAAASGDRFLDPASACLDSGDEVAGNLYVAGWSALSTLIDGSLDVDGAGANDIDLGMHYRPDDVRVDTFTVDAASVTYAVEDAAACVVMRGDGSTVQEIAAQATPSGWFPHVEAPGERLYLICSGMARPAAASAIVP